MNVGDICEKFHFEGLFENFFNEPFGIGLFKAAKGPALDVYEKEGNLLVQAELPGLEKGDIDIRVDGDILTISGRKRHEKELKKDNYYHVERSYGTVQRSIRLPQGAKTDQIKASYKNGVLTLQIPKTGKGIDNSRKIELE